MRVHGKLDAEVVSLIRAMNKLEGITTIESCSGHNERPFHIWFWADSLEDLPALLYWFDVCHSGVKGWRVFVRTDCSMAPVTFCVEGPVGDFEGARMIALAIREHLAENE